MIICKKKGGMMNSGNQTDVKRKEILKAIETLSLLDDNLMTLVFDRNTEATELLLNVIVDGNVMERELTMAGKDPQWLREQLKRQNFDSPKEVFLATVDQNDTLTCFPNK